MSEGAARLAPPLIWTVLESWPWWCGCRRAHELTNSAATQAQTQGFELVHPNIYPIHELLEHLKGLVLQIPSYRISMTQDNKGLSEKSSSDRVSKARGLLQYQWIIAINIWNQRSMVNRIYCGMHWDTLQHPLWDLFFLFWGRGCKGGECVQGGGRDEQDWDSGYEIHKELIKLF